MYPPDREVLKGIWLSFFPGAKIGVLGSNGAGKSTLLRIMAGVDKEFLGEAWPAEGITGRLSLAGAAARSRARTCSATSRRASPRRARCSTASRRSARSSARPRDADEMEKLLDEQAQPAGRASTRANALGARPHARDRDGRAARPARRRRRSRRSPAASGAASRSAACCLQAPDLLLLDEPTNHLDAESVAWLERHLQEYQGTVVAITHDRYFLDNVAGWILELDRGAGIPWEGNYSLVARPEAGAPRASRRSRSRRARRTLARELEWVRMAPRARQAKSKARAERVRGAARGARASSGARHAEIAIPPGPRLGRPRRRGQGPPQGLRRPAADRRPRRSRCRPAASSASSARTAPARRRSSA